MQGIGLDLFTFDSVNVPSFSQEKRFGLKRMQVCLGFLCDIMRLKDFQGSVLPFWEFF